MTSNAGYRLRNLFNAEKTLICASVFDPLSSRMAEQIGYKVGILGGSVVSSLTLGTPDIYLLTLSELAEQARRVCKSSTLPVIVDGDNGYGNALNTIRTVKVLQEAGAAAVTIEDSALPYPHDNPRRSLIDIDEACSKLLAAVETRSDPDFLIIARTLASDSQTLDELLHRVNAYSRCGVDVICLFGITCKERLAAVASITDLPLMIISYGTSLICSAQELSQHGVVVYMKGHSAYEAAIKATYVELADVLGDSKAAASEINGKQLIQQLTENDRYEKLINSYL